MKKIIFVCYLNLTKKMEEDFYLDYLKEQGLEIEYWDITNAYFTNLQLNDGIQRSYVRKFFHLSYIEKALKEQNIENTIFIPLITFEYRVLNLFRLFLKYNCTLFFFRIGLYPNYNDQRTRVDKVISICEQLVTGTLITRIIAFIYKKIGLVHEYNLVFCAGQAAFDMYQGVARVVPINFYDYDRYLLYKNENKRLISETYCVFLDDNLPYHPDFKMLGVKSEMLKDYYNLLNAFFDKLEEKYYLRVVIAAHPKSNYTINPFNGRVIYKYQTHRLVKDCEFAVSFASTSIGYAVLYYRPLIILSSNEVKKYIPFYFPISKAFAAFLGSNFYNIDTITKEEIAISRVDVARYDSYKYTYLVSKSAEGQQSKNIVLNILRQQ